MSDLKYCVLLKSQEPWEPGKVAEAYAKHARIPFADATQHLRGSWGILAENVEESAAKDLGEKLEAAGFGAIVLPANLLEDLPEPLVTCQVQLDDDGLRLLPKTGERTVLPWNRLALIAAACYKEISKKTVKTVEGPSLGQKAASIGLTLATGLPVNIGGKQREIEKVQESSEPVFFLDLYERKPARRFRIDAQDFNYACLGPRMQYSSVVNFKTLCEIVSGKTPNAMRNRGTSFILGGKPANTMGYDSLKDLDREGKWLSTLISLRDP